MIPIERLIMTKHIDEVIDALLKESDRAGAILCAVTLDETLKELLGSALISNYPKDIFKNHGPLATFSARINMAYSMGLISQNEYRELHLIRKVRNEFAHDVSHKLSFETDKIRNRVDELSSGDPIFEKIEVTDANRRFYVVFAMLESVISTARKPKVKPTTPDNAPPIKVQS